MHTYECETCGKTVEIEEIEVGLYAHDHEYYEHGQCQACFAQDLKQKRKVSQVDDLDEAYPDGKYVSLSPKPPRIRLGDLYAFCQEKGINPEDLTDAQKNRFYY